MYSPNFIIMYVSSWTVTTKIPESRCMDVYIAVNIIFFYLKKKSLFVIFIYFALRGHTAANECKIVLSDVRVEDTSIILTQCQSVGAIQV